MSDFERKQAIESAIKAFASHTLYQAGMGLLDALGYHSDLTLQVSGLKAFRNTLDQSGRLKDGAAKTAEWENVEFLRQITGEDVSVSDQGAIRFQKEYQPTEIQSYVAAGEKNTKAHATATVASPICGATEICLHHPRLWKPCCGIIFPL